MAGSESAKVRLVSNRGSGQLERALGNLMGASTASSIEVKQPEPRPATSSEKKADPVEGLVTLPIAQIGFGPFRLRLQLSQGELEGLAQSIRSKGVIQPILVRIAANTDNAANFYELVAGERRLQAATLVGLSNIPAVIGSFSDREVLELAIIENAQREDLNPIEEAIAIKRLADEFKLTQTEIAEIIGKNRATISNAIRLLQLEPEIIELLKIGDLSAGHGRALLMLTETDLRLKVARKTVTTGLSVRALEKLIARIEENSGQEPSEAKSSEKQRLERLRARVEEHLDLDVNLALTAAGNKKLTIAFPSEAAWKRFYAKIRQ